MTMVYVKKLLEYESGVGKMLKSVRTKWPDSY